MKREALAVLIGVLLVIAGCGGSSPSQPTARDLASQLAESIRARDGSRLRHVHCVERNPTTFRCVGDYTPSDAAVRDTMKGIDTSTFGAADWQALRDQNSGPATYEVTVDPHDGTAIWKAE